jgi:hypothetical protein
MLSFADFSSASCSGRVHMFSETLSLSTLKKSPLFTFTKIPTSLSFFFSFFGEFMKKL